MSNFFTILRKKGVEVTLSTLNDQSNEELKQSNFFKNLKDREEYVNSFFRVKSDLLENKLIAFKLDEDNDKVIYLTEKGKELYKKILEIQDIMTD